MMLFATLSFSILLKHMRVSKVRVNLQVVKSDDSTPAQNTIKHWINEAIKMLGKEIPSTQNEITIRIIDADESAHLNETYRNKSGPTNVLAFEDKPLAGLQPDSIGDLAICADLVKEEAKDQNKPIQAHWAHLIIHGLLHLLGYDHLNDSDAKVMENLEVKILTQLGFANPYDPP
jgi:probable rRNA maturation factor